MMRRVRGFLINGHVHELDNGTIFPLNIVCLMQDFRRCRIGASVHEEGSLHEKLLWGAGCSRPTATGFSYAQRHRWLHMSIPKVS
jgi:hypothetical protein